MGVDGSVRFWGMRNHLTLITSLQDWVAPRPVCDDKSMSENKKLLMVGVGDYESVQEMGNATCFVGITIKCRLGSGSCGNQF